jgi:hypothetical protein
LSIYKKIIIFSVIALIILIYILNTILDFSRLFNYYALYSLFPNEILKRINVLLATALVWFVGKDTIRPHDSQLMKCVFIFICCGEICFLLAKPAFAIVFFITCQCLLIIRHSKGFGSKLIASNSKQRLILAMSALVPIMLIFIGVIMLLPLVTLNSLVLIAATYGIILSISLWAGLANHILGLFPYPNSKMVAIGMLCFFCCDVLVGLDGLLNYSTAWIVASSFIWVFYTPAITLLALSCYRYSAKSYSSAIIANT